MRTTGRQELEVHNEVLAMEEGIAMASEVLLRISRDEAERARLISEYKYVVDTQSKVVQAKREGRKAGRKEGHKEGRLEVARKLKSRGVAAEQIAEDTGLTLAQIAEL
jgi:predicted transposase/invertase (TIGR01784 family)